MFKILILGGIILIVYILFFKKPKKDSKKNEELTMLECQKCGTFISDKESIKKDNKIFCSNRCAT